MFETFWKLYSKPIGKKLAKQKFLALTLENCNKAIQVAPIYVANTPDTKFRKHASTWLNQECFNDEYEDKTQGISSGNLKRYDFYDIILSLWHTHIKQNKRTKQKQYVQSVHMIAGKSEPCLSVNIDEGVWNCHNCGWTGALKKYNYMAEIKYTKPKAKVIVSNYSKEFLQYFKERGIVMKKTLMANKVTEGKEFMPQMSRRKKHNTI